MIRTRSLILSSALVLGACGTQNGAREGEGQESAGRPRSATNETAVASDTTWTFDDLAIGALPAGWRVEATNPRGDGVEWSVQQDMSAPSGDQVLSLTDTRGARGSTFNLAWTDRVEFLDGTVEVKVKAGTGREDQGGGPTWRVQDRNNYYIARWNPLEDNVRLYYVRDSDREMVENASAVLSTDEWHTITIRHQGNRIDVSVDGQLLIEATDDTFAESGGVGLWTKADAATSFDDLLVRGAKEN